MSIDYPYIDKYPIFQQKLSDISFYRDITKTSLAIDLKNYISNFYDEVQTNLVFQENCNWIINNKKNFFDDYEENNDIDSNRIKMSLRTGRIGIKFNDGIIYYSIQKSIKFFTINEIITQIKFVSLSSNIGENHINEFANYIIEKIESNDINYIKIFSYIDGDGWNNNGKIPKRNISNIYMDTKTKNEISELIANFYSSKYKERTTRLGIKPSLTILLEGPPGVGKTSMITALASKYNKSISTFQISPNTSNNDISLAFRYIRNNSWLIIEDFDSIFHASGQRELSNTSITFSTLLNVLDGHQRKPGLVVFLTTNKGHMVKGVIDRPGRIDRRFSFRKLEKPYILQMIQNFFNETDESTCIEINNIICKQKPIPSAAIMQKFLWNILQKYGESINVNNINENLDLLTNEISLEVERDKIDDGRHNYI